MDFYRGLLTPEDEATAKQEQAEDLLRFKRQSAEPTESEQVVQEQPEENR